MADQSVGETRDGTGCGDHDMPYFWGNPHAYLNTRDKARLLVLRGYIIEARHKTNCNTLGGEADTAEHE